MIIVVAGPAGSGKTALGDALAARLQVPHMDFDVVTSDLVACERARVPERSEAVLLAAIRDERYKVLAAEVRRLFKRHPDLVVSAPFTREAADPVAWLAWSTQAAGPREPVFLWMDVEPGERRRRMSVRGSSRDTELLDTGQPLERAALPVIPHLRVDAAHPTEEQLKTLLRQLR